MQRLLIRFFLIPEHVRNVAHGLHFCFRWLKIKKDFLLMQVILLLILNLFLADAKSQLHFRETPASLQGP